MSTTNHTSDRRPNRSDDRGLRAHLEPGGDGATCTLFPADVSAEELTTTWISADAGSYVTLTEMR